MVKEVSRLRLTAVPETQRFSVSAHLRGLVRRGDIPAGFAGFATFTFSTCYALKNRDYRDLLREALSAYRRVIGNNDALRVFAETLRLNGIRNVTFQLAYEYPSAALVLNVIGKAPGEPRMSTQIILREYGPELAPYPRKLS